MSETPETSRTPGTTEPLTPTDAATPAAQTAGTTEISAATGTAAVTEAPAATGSAAAAETSVTPASEAAGTAETPAASGSVGATGTAAADAATATAGRRPGRRRRRCVAAVAASALLACAVVGAVGYTVVTVQDADRDPGEPTWKFAAQDQQGAREPKTGSGPGLRALFLPFGVDGYDRGPDLPGFGADAEFSGRQATALRKESVKDLPSATRRKAERLIDRERIQGMAMRSYLVRVGNEFDGDLFTAEITLSRMQNRGTVREMSESFSSFLAVTDVFRKGPRIEGHEKNARCFLTPKSDDKHAVEGLYCSAYQGDVLVNATVHGPAPVDTKAVAAFLAAQLDRIDDPGQAV